MNESDRALLASARSTLGSNYAERARGEVVVVDLLGEGSRVLWPDFAEGPSKLLAVLAAEQRYLVEQVGSGSVPGRTYLEKAEERRRRWQETWSERA